MTSTERTALVEQTLLRAAERLGDVTAPVLAAYYQRVPESKAAFEHHAGVNRSQLEGEMVENSLYCLMSWFESPGEIEMLLAGSVPHHEETLRVPPHWYEELLEATRSEEHTSELQSRGHLVCCLLLEKKRKRE